MKVDKNDFDQHSDKYIAYCDHIQNYYNLYKFSGITIGLVMENELYKEQFIEFENFRTCVIATDNTLILVQEDVEKGIVISSKIWDDYLFVLEKFKNGFLVCEELKLWYIDLDKNLVELLKFIDDPFSYTINQKTQTIQIELYNGTSFLLKETDTENICTIEEFFKLND